MKIKLDKKKCIGCGNCAAVCPEIFEMKGDKANLKVKETDNPCATKAANECPVKAIEVK